MKRLFALRGAAQCENKVNDICEQVTLMYDELLCANKLDENEIVSVVFSVTEDLKAVNPCSALRKNGRAGELALFSAVEPDCIGSLERTVRVLIHCYLEEGSQARHIYRNGAEVLRPDRVNIVS
jgi:chorismate mutase